MVDAFTQRGLTVHPLSAEDLLVESDNLLTKVRVNRPGRGPTREEREANTNADRVQLYTLTRITPTLKNAALENPNIALMHPLDGLVVFNGQAHEPEAGRRPQAARGRPAWGKFAVIRALLRTREARTQEALAGETGVSQAAVSKTLLWLGNSVQRAGAGWRAVEPEELWRRFFAEYPGVGGMRSYWYSIDTLAKQAEQIQSLSSQSLVSGDVALDRIVPWARPQRAVVYGAAPVDFQQLDFSGTVSDRATLEFVIPRDPTIQRTAAAARTDPMSARHVGLTDPLIACWEALQHSSSDETVEAVEQVRRKVLREWNR